MLIRKRKKTPLDLSGIRGNFPKCEANIFLAVLASQRPRGAGEARFHRSYLDPVTPHPGLRRVPVPPRGVLCPQHPAARAPGTDCGRAPSGAGARRPTQQACRAGIIPVVDAEAGLALCWGHMAGV